jgi:hypothetical protein
MPLDPITTLPSIKSELEASWKLFDDVFNSFDAVQWRKRFGKTWTYAEQPWHLAYFDGMIARHLAYGPNVPDSERMYLRSMGEIDEWNKRELAKRGASHTVNDSLAEMRKQRDAVRAQLASMTEQDLDARAWQPIVFGWVTKRELVQTIIVHNVAEYWKLWLRTGRKSAAPSAAAVHLRLSFVMTLMSAMMNREVAAKKPFRMVWNFDGPGGGSWTFSVVDGACTVSPFRAPVANLQITMKPENFHKLVAKMTPPPLLMLTGQMKIKGFGAMGTFAKLFPDPKPDQILELTRR